MTKKQIRILLWVLVPSLCVILFFVGAMIGYSRFGGRPPLEALEWHTWKHMFDLVFSE